MSTIRVVNIQHSDATEPNIVLEADGTATFASGITISGGTNLTVSGTAEFASGTASAPGITFIDDNNTGIYEPAVDTVAITTATTERLRIDSLGRVGIGCTPASALQLKRATPELSLQPTADTQTGYITFINSASSTRGAVEYNYASDYMAFKSAASERMRIDSSGNVGIGTTNPGYKLEITEASANSLVRFDGANSAQLVFRNATSNVFEINAAGANDELSFGTAGNNERMRIDSSGNVMIGTTTPGAGGGDELTLATSGQTGITIRSGTTSKGAIYFADGTSGSDRYRGYFEYDHNSNYLRVGTDDTERLRIDNSGYLGIGTSNPTSRLTVIDTTQDIQARFGSLANTCDPFIRFQGRNIADDRNCFADIQLDSENQLLLLNDPGTNSASIGNNPVAVDSTGRLLVGTTSTTGLSSNAMLSVDSDSSSAVRINLINSGSSAVESTQFGSQNNDIFFNASSSEKMRILSGGGITFNGDTATANALDDYEEGTFTPVYEGSTTPGSYSYGSQGGHYTKIGRLVTVRISLVNINTSSAGTGLAQIGGLPFTSQSNQSFETSSPRFDQFNFGGSTTYVVGTINNNSTDMNFYEISSGSGDTGLTVTAKASDTADIFLVGTYFAA